MLKIIKPSVVLLMETELWFNFLREASKSGAKIGLVNGRLSKKSAARYLYIRKFVARVLSFVDLALMQGERDAKRLIQLGIDAEKVKVTGNIKFDQKFDEGENNLTRELRGTISYFKRCALNYCGKHPCTGRKVDFAGF
ncbi:MAG: glycosyltransferase N-terminal domain-containing protein [Pyrinomonadaceae bacterium]